MSTAGPRPFVLDVPEGALEDLRERLSRVRWPEAETVSGPDGRLDWSQGPPRRYVVELVDYWPMEVADQVADPPGAELPAFHVVAPSLPGFGFSGKPAGTGWGVHRTADAWAELMTRLGYDRFYAVGGDWGGRVTTALGCGTPIGSPGCTPSPPTSPSPSTTAT